MRQRILQTRELKYHWLYERLREQSDFLIAFYAKKKSNKKSNTLVKNLKKLFEPKSSANKELVREQMVKMCTRNSIDCQTLYRSIDIRAKTILFQLFGKMKNKDLYAEEIEQLKIEISNGLKKIKALRKKHDDIEIELFSLPDKEIKENVKKSKGRKPTKELLALVKLYKVDTAKWIKDDKTLKPAKAKYLKKGMKKRPTMSQFSESLLQSELGEMNVTIGEDGLPIEEMEGMDGEEEEKEGEEKGEDEADGGADGDDKGGDDDENKDSAAQLDNAEGDEEGKELAKDGSGSLSKKRGSVSKSPKKGKKKGEDFKMELINWKASTKTKGRLIVADKITNPPEILDYIAANFEEGLEGASVENLKQIIHKMYVKPERKKLAGFYEFKKTTPTIA